MQADVLAAPLTVGHNLKMSASVVKKHRNAKNGILSSGYDGLSPSPKRIARIGAIGYRGVEKR